MTRHAGRDRLRLRPPRRRVRVQRNDLRVAVRTHDDAISHPSKAFPPWNESLRGLFRFVENIAVLRKHGVLKCTALAEELAALQQVHVATDHVHLRSSLADPQLALAIDLAIDERQHRHRLHVARAVHEVLRNRRRESLPVAAAAAPRTGSP